MSQINGKQILDATITKAKTTTEIIAADGTRAFTADQSHGGFKITNVGNGTAAGDGINKGQLDAAIAGLDWQEAAELVYYIGTRTVTQINALAPSAGWTVVAGSAGTPTAGTSDALAVGDVAEFDGTSWKKIVSNSGGFVPSGTRLVVAWTATLFSPLIDGTDEGKIANFDGTSNTASSLQTSLDGWAIFCKGAVSNPPTAYNENKQFTFGGVVPTGTWTQFGAGVSYAGVGEITTINPGDAASAGTSANVPRGDHQHAVSTAAPSVTVKSEATAAAEGTATSGMRSDAQIQVATATPGTTIKSDATAASQGTSSSLLRADAQLVALTAAPSSVGTANAAGSSSSLARADHIHDSPAPVTSNKNLTASVTTTDNDQATATTVASANALGGYVGVRVNGVHVNVGDGTKVSVDAYFSGDGGVTARAMSAIVAGDTCRWNGSVALYQLAATDRLDFDYGAF